VIGPNVAFLMTVAGVLGIYCEFIWPGRLLPGIFGAVLLIFGVHALWRLGPTVTGLILIGIAATLFIGDAVWDSRFVAGCAATVALVAGSALLLPRPFQIAPVLAVTLPVILGVVTMGLSYTARRARRNKWSDIPK
jgi:membrane-bound serine protease (ClpP class)